MRSSPAGISAAPLPHLPPPGLGCFPGSLTARGEVALLHALSWRCCQDCGTDRGVIRGPFTGCQRESPDSRFPGDSPRQSRGRGRGRGRGGVAGVSTSTEWRHRSGGAVQVCRPGHPGWQGPDPHSAPPVWLRARPAGVGRWMGERVPCQPWEHWASPPPADSRPPRGPVWGQGEGLRVGLTSMVSVSSTALFPLMAATLRSSRRPRSSLPVMRSHRADSASHLQGFGGGWEGHCLWAPGPGLDEPHCPSVSFCPGGWPHWQHRPQAQATLSAFFLLPLGWRLGGPVLPLLPPS